VALIAGPALAQAVGDDDWDFSRDPARKAVVAAATFDSGVGLAARCVDGAYDVLFSGLPPVSTALRTLTFTYAGAPPVENSWAVGSDGTSAFSDLPAPLARRLRAGGRVEVTVPAANGQPAKRFVLELPRSERAIDETLTACDRPLSDPRDTLLTPLVPASGPGNGVRWETPPSMAFPERAMRRNVETGAVTLSCLVKANGRLDDCVVETERPAGVGFGQAALDGARRARLASTSGEAVAQAGGAVTYRATFFLQ
jgi:TonB family protein